MLHIGRLSNWCGKHTFALLKLSSVSSESGESFGDERKSARTDLAAYCSSEGSPSTSWELQHVRYTGVQYSSPLARLHLTVLHEEKVVVVLGYARLELAYTMNTL
jgi:hypothetical protein